MARHLIDEREAFELLRSHSRRTGRKLVDVAAAVVDVHLLLPASTRPPARDCRSREPSGRRLSTRTERRVGTRGQAI